ncbi:hypothetical protein E1B28_000518 [Marasmius oreades]|uniref:Phosphatidate cytidylyltransferase n=1 Tax=Marasmius oreades TaxID=181124 RepID=A0A9P8AE77_9AGAR|nr:uncharacterized protein E1B28_000518 [Marasmius oreades]KAG7098591.1 hypothetical protein E1B28_000518 [Marasmius oreades]
MNAQKSRFASQTLFSALAVESGDEESEEQVEEVAEPETTPQVEPPVPPTLKISKSALKKAAREAKQKARFEAQQNKEETALPNGKLHDVAPSPPGATAVEFPPETTIEDAAHGVQPDPSTAAVSHSAPPSSAEAPATEEREPDQVKINTHEEPAEVFLPPLEPVEPFQVVHEAPREVLQIEAPHFNSNAPPPSRDEKKKQNLTTRTLWTFIMIGGFIGLLLLGHAYLIILVMLCQTLVYREVTALFSLKGTPQPGFSERRNGNGNGKDPWSKTLNWYFFAVTNYFLYGESIIYYFKHVVFSDAQLHAFATNHRIISFTLYTIGFVGFVTSLKKGYLKQQFGLFCWVHMSLLLIVVSSHFVVNNILEGLIWFWVPASLVICNDCFAYLCGITLGRTPLIKLSPKKTVEGFLGAFWCTMVFSLLWGAYFMRFKYMICPVHDLGVNAWSNVDCVPNPVFQWKEWTIPEPFTSLLSTALGRTVTTSPYVPYFGHLLVMSSFASLVAPFGGFFASGFKRAFNIKDFGHSIPGHGGMTDRMDCQFLMGVFTYVYYSSLIRQHSVSVGSVLQTIVRGLAVEEQLELIADLRKYLDGMGVQVPG